MDQIGKMYQNRAMVLQEEVTRLEQLLLELRINRQNVKDTDIDYTPKTSEQRDAEMVVGGGSMVPGSDNSDPDLGPDGIAKQIGKGLLNFPFDHPYIFTGALLASQFPNRAIDPESVGKFGAWKAGEHVKGKGPGDPVMKKPRFFNMVDRLVRHDEIQKEKFREKAKADAQAKAKADAQAKADADRIKTNDFSKKYASQQPDSKREPRQPIVDPVTGKPVVDPVTGQPVLEPKGRLNNQGIDDTIETQRKRHIGTPHERVTPESLDAMESGQMRQQAVSDPRLSPEVPAAPNRGGGNAAATAIDYPTPRMNGREVREVARKLGSEALDVGSKALNVGGKFMDLPGEAASTFLGTIGRTLFGTAVGGGMGMLPAVIGFFDSPAYAPTFPLTQKEQDEWDANIKSYEESERKRKDGNYSLEDDDESGNTALEKFATNPSGNFTPYPETQFERDDRARLGLSQPVAVDMRRIAAKNGTRRNQQGEREQDFLQRRQQQ